MKRKADATFADDAIGTSSVVGDDDDKDGACSYFLSSSARPNTAAVDDHHPSACCGRTAKSAPARASEQPPSTSKKDSTTAITFESQADALLLKEWNSLSLQERDKVYEEVHGVHEQVEERPEMIASALQAMQKEIFGSTKSRRKKERAALDKVAFFAPHRLRHHDTLLQFLRAEEYDPTRAVQRMARYFEFSLQNFGMDAIFREPCYTDMTEEDVVYLNSGTFFPLQNVTDRSGRPIVMFFDAYSQFKRIETVTRTMLYIYMQVLKDPIAQRKGIVVILWSTTRRTNFIPPFSPSLLKQAGALYDAIPITLSAIHFCYDNAAIQPVIEMAKFAIGQRGRVRLRTHFGSDTECKYSLMTFGIDPSRFPLTYDGHLIPNGFLEWIAMIAQQESIDASSDSVIVPSSKDILLGRGQPFRVFPGNQRLSQLVEEQWCHYSSCGTHEKKLVLQNMAHALAQEGRHFLKRDAVDEPWYEVSQTKALSKIDFSFRNKPVVQRYHESRFDKMLGDDLDMMMLHDDA